MQTLIYQFKEKQIEFLLTGDVMVNATEMASVYGKRVYEFTRRPETKLFVDKLSKRPIGDFKYGDFPHLFSGIDDFDPKKVVKSVNGVPILITIPGNEGGTWMHRWLAIDFAMWLDLDFKIWVIEKIDYLLINFSNKQRELISEKQELLRQKDLILKEQKDNPHVIRINEINESLKKISQKMGSATKSQYQIWNNIQN